MKPKRKRKKPDEITIDMDDALMIIGSRANLELCQNTCFCLHCSNHTTTVVNFDIYLNNLNDIILNGECIRCGHPVARYIETGENEEKAAIACHIRSVYKGFKTL